MSAIQSAFNNRYYNINTFDLVSSPATPNVYVTTKVNRIKSFKHYKSVLIEESIQSLDNSKYKKLIDELLDNGLSDKEIIKLQSDFLGLTYLDILKNRLKDIKKERRQTKRKKNKGFINMIAWFIEW